MKKLGLSVVVLFLTVSLGFSQDAKKEEGKALISFEKTIYDFGKIEYKGDGSCVFKFKNSGKAPLIVSNVKPSCGCTLANGWKKEPIKVGESSQIKIKYDTKRQGKFSKTISVYSNGSSAPVRLQIKGVVGKKPASEQAKKQVIKKETTKKAPVKNNAIKKVK